jgi:hypothetical protein
MAKIKRTKRQAMVDKIKRAKRQTMVDTEN